VKRLLGGHTTDGDAAWTEVVGTVLNSKEVKKRADYKALIERGGSRR
jgi:hypothetical protein